MLKFKGGRSYSGERFANERVWPGLAPVLAFWSGLLAVLFFLFMLQWLHFKFLGIFAYSWIDFIKSNMAAVEGNVEFVVQQVLLTYYSSAVLKCHLTAWSLVCNYKEVYILCLLFLRRSSQERVSSANRRQLESLRQRVPSERYGHRNVPEHPDHYTGQLPSPSPWARMFWWRGVPRNFEILERDASNG